MTIAQCKAARRKGQQHYGKVPIGVTRYKRKSLSSMERREQQRREKQTAMQGRKKKARG